MSYLKGQDDQILSSLASKDFTLGAVTTKFGSLFHVSGIRTSLVALFCTFSSVFMSFSWQGLLAWTWMGGINAQFRISKLTLLMVICFLFDQNAGRSFGCRFNFKSFYNRKVDTIGTFLNIDSVRLSAVHISPNKLYIKVNFQIKGSGHYW